MHRVFISVASLSMLSTLFFVFQFHTAFAATTPAAVNQWLAVVMTEQNDDDSEDEDLPDDDGTGEDEDAEDDSDIKDDEDSEDEEGDDVSDDDEDSEDDTDGEDEDAEDDSKDEDEDKEAYEPDEDASDDLAEAEESGNCFEVFNAKAELFNDEAAYYLTQAQTIADNESAVKDLLDAANLISQLQLAISTDRLRLEALPGKSKQCEENEDNSDIQDLLEEQKIKIRNAAEKIDSGDAQALDGEAVEKVCEAADDKMEKLADKMNNLTEKINDALEDGEIDFDLSSAKEILNIAQVNFGEAAIAYATAEDIDNANENKMTLCFTARTSANNGLSLFKKAKKYFEGDKDGDSSTLEDIDVKLKTFIEVIAEKRLEALQRDNREEILAFLAAAQNRVYEIQLAFAPLRAATLLGEEVDENLLDAIQEQLDNLKDEIKTVVDEIEQGTEEEWNAKERQQSSKKLLNKAKKQFRQLSTLEKSAIENANTDEEEEYLDFVQGGAIIDAANAKSIANGFRKRGDYTNAQLQALRAIELAKAGKKLLQEIE